MNLIMQIPSTDSEAEHEESRARRLKKNQDIYDLPGQYVNLLCADCDGVMWEVHDFKIIHWQAFKGADAASNVVNTVEVNVHGHAPAIVDAAINELYFDDYAVPDLKNFKLLHASDEPEDATAMAELNSACLRSEMHFHLYLLLFARYAGAEALRDVAMEKIKTCLKSSDCIGQ